MECIDTVHCTLFLLPDNCALFGGFLAIMEITCLSDELSAFCHLCTIFATLGSIDCPSHQSDLLTVANLSLKDKLFGVF